MNKLAWGILTEDEKSAVTLQHVHEKSSWQAGEILNKSHYKYLEIKYRGEQFLKLFTQHFSLFDTIVPINTSGNQEVKDYFTITIQQRRKVSEAYTELNTRYGYTGNNQREEEVIKQMKAWEQSDNPYDLTLYNLIKEFDRWNNFRILPIQIQEPSAFKRRNKKAHQKNIKISSTIPDISIPKIKKLFGERSKDKVIWIGIISQRRDSHLIAIKDTASVQEQITQINFYIFEDKAIAKEYLELVFDYTQPAAKKCKDGLEFWPRYREVIKLARNYEAIQKIVPSRKTLQMALNKISYL